jgi:hypothetical protein
MGLQHRDNMAGLVLHGLSGYALAAATILALLASRRNNRQQPFHLVWVFVGWFQFGSAEVTA